MTDFGRRAAVVTADVMLKSVYDPDADGVVALAQTEADMTRAVYDDDHDGSITVMHTQANMETSTYDPEVTGIVADARKLENSTKAQVQDHTPKSHTHATPSAHKATHQDGGADEIDCSLLAGRHQYVDRGDPAAWDWDKDDFIFDGTWRALDCSSIVPAGAKFIYFRVSFKTGAAGQSFSLRKNGNSNTIVASAVRTQVLDYFNEQSFIVPCSAARVVDYFTTAAPTVGCNVAILGWLI